MTGTARAALEEFEELITTRKSYGDRVGLTAPPRWDNSLSFR
jgi:hypothetical protein